MTTIYAQDRQPDHAKRQIGIAQAFLSMIQDEFGIDMAEARVALQNAWHGAAEHELLLRWLIAEHPDVLDAFYRDKTTNGQVRYV